METTEQTRAVVRRYVETLNQRDWSAFSALLADDVLYELPQTGERISGREKYLRFNQEYPGDWLLTVTRLVADGRSAAVTMDVTVGDATLVAVVFLELDGELVRRITDFWPEPYEPPTGREHLVERAT